VGVINLRVEQQTDVLIVGAGIVGLSIGIALLQAEKGLRVLIVDKESAAGEHASGRNSGVLHAGFYYSPDSLKAKFCREGNLELRKLCRENSIPIQECGKVVVSRNSEEDGRLDLLYSRGLSNGVELELLEKTELSKYEPLAITHQRFLWSPNTAISDPRAVIKAMVSKFEGLGGKLSYGQRIEFQRTQDGVSAKKFRAKYVINSAGAQSDRLAKELGLAKRYAMVPFMGVYRAVSSDYLPLKRLVYPVPHPINPFLGVHFTLTLDGKVKIGPTAIPILGREQYSLFEGWSLSDIGQAITATKALIKGQSHKFGEILKSELPKLQERSLVRESALLVPGALSIRKWQKKPPGIRSQLVDIKTGKLEQDFIVENFKNSTHILNAVSPGWTSALPFGRWVAEVKVLPNLWA
jgi:L-2-hydroxyglutarate oxidase LhgO